MLNSDEYRSSPTPTPSSGSLYTLKKSEPDTSDVRVSSDTSDPPKKSETYPPKGKFQSGSSYTPNKNEANTPDAKLTVPKDSDTIDSLLTTVEQTVKKLRQYWKQKTSTSHPYRRHARAIWNSTWNFDLGKKLLGYCVTGIGFYTIGCKPRTLMSAAREMWWSSMSIGLVLNLLDNDFGCRAGCANIFITFLYIFFNTIQIPGQHSKCTVGSVNYCKPAFLVPTPKVTPEGRAGSTTAHLRLGHIK